MPTQCRSLASIRLPLRMLSAQCRPGEWPVICPILSTAETAAFILHALILATSPGRFGRSTFTFQLRRPFAVFIPAFVFVDPSLALRCAFWGKI